MSPIRTARHARNLKQVQLAEELGISQAHLSQLERCEDRASPQLAAKIAALLGISELEVLYPERYMPLACAGTVIADR